MSEITREQLDKLRAYLDEDCQSHLRSGGKWHLDRGKLAAALAEAGVTVKASPEDVFEPWQLPSWDDGLSQKVEEGARRLEMPIYNRLGVQTARVSADMIHLARRIVACINACKGLPTEALEKDALWKALDVAKQLIFDAQAVEHSWEKGDLAEAVNNLTYECLIEQLRPLGWWTEMDQEELEEESDN